MSKLVLRSLNLSENLDEALRVIAFHKRMSKSDLIRGMLETGVQQHRSDLAKWAPNVLRQLEREPQKSGAKAGGGSHASDVPPTSTG